MPVYNKMPINRIENDSVIEEYGDDYLNYCDGSSYKGDLIYCENNDYIREGFGVMKYSDKKSSYSGYYKNNLKNGYGKFIYNNGDIYEGEFLNGIKSGNGKYTFNDGQTYEGGFLNDVMWGYGKLISYFDKKSFIYEGEFQNGKKHGKGKYIYKEKYDINDFDDDDELEIQFYEEEFEGTWVNDEKHGMSEFKTKGLWRNNNLISTIENERFQNKINAENAEKKKKNKKIYNYERERFQSDFDRDSFQSDFDRDRFHYMFPPDEIYEFY